MRYIELNDSSGAPIFEGDNLSLNIKENTLGNSYLGKICKMYDLNTIKIKILENGTNLQIKFQLSFYKDNEKALTKQQEKYWSYLEDTKPEDLRKTIEDFSDIEDADSFYEPIIEDTIFFRYLSTKGFEKIDGKNAVANLTPDSDFTIGIKEEIYKVNDSKTLKLPEKVIEDLQSDFPVNNAAFVNKDFGYATFNFKKNRNFFDYDIEVELTNEKGECLVYWTESEKAASLKRNLRMAQRDYDEEENEDLKEEVYKEDLEDAKKSYNEIKKSEGDILRPYKPFLGLKGEKSMLVYLMKNQ